MAAATGSNNRATTGIDDFNLTYTSGTNTSVQFASTGSSVNEGDGTVDLTLEITDEDATNDTEVDVVLITGAAGRVNSYTTQTVTFPAGSSADEDLTITITDNLLCDGNTVIGFELQNISGGQGTPTIGTNDTYDLSITDNDVCTNVSFAVSSASVSENSTTYNVVVNITDFSASQATSVQVALASGSAARINNYTTQTVTFPANDGTAQNVAITITNNSNCDGSEVLTFNLQNVSGGQGTPTMGANRTLTITDDEVAAPPVATAATAVSSTQFTAHWNAIAGATNYRLDVYTIEPGGVLAEWTFPTSGTTVTPDASIPANSSMTLSTAGGVSALSDATGATTRAPSATAWNAGNGTKYWMVEFNSQGYGGLQISSKQRSSDSGPRDFKIQYRIGTGGAWTDVSGGSITVDNTVGFTSGTVTDLSLPAACEDQAQVFLRWIMTSNTSVNAGTVGAAGTSRIDDIRVFSTGSVQYVSGYNNFDAGTNTSHTVTGLSAGTTYNYVVRATGGCAAAGNSNQITVLTPAISDYYSQSSGDVDDEIWSDSPVGTPGPASWTSDITMHVQSGHTVTNTASVTLGNVDVEGTLVLADGSALTVNGDEFLSTGTITAADNSLVELFGEDVIISVAGTPSFFDVTIGNTSLALADEPFAIRGTLLIESGEFETESTVIMQSDINGTGRLGPLGGTYTGDITMQRYIPAGATNWRLMGSPVAGQTVNEWKDDFTTAGFPGSHVPSFDNPQGSGNLWPSVRWYDETVLSSNPDVGLVGATNITQSLATGQGFAAWCGTTLATTSAFTVDMVGAPHTAQTPIDLPVTYTTSGNALADGYNLVSNPLPSPISWTALDRTNVSGTIYVFNPAEGNTGSFTIGIGGTLGVTDTLQSSQAFFVKATGASPSLQVDEADKVLARSYGGLFGGSQFNLFSGIRLRIASAINQFSDETVVAFHMGAPDVDENDVAKIVLAHPDAPQIATRTESGVGMMVNAYGPYEIEIAIPVAVNVGVSGTYTITATNFENIGLSCLTLEDLETGTITPMSAGAVYTFTASATDDEEDARFVLRATAPVPMIPDNATCFEADNGRGTVVHTGDAPMNVEWIDAGGNTFLEQTIESGVAVTGDLAPGEYAVRVNSNGACGDLNTVFTITEPGEMEVMASINDASCMNTLDGSVDVTVLGGTAPYSYMWSNGEQSEDITAGAGDYLLEVTDAHGCVLPELAFGVLANDGLQASGSAESTTTPVNTAVAFNTTVEEGTTISWDFGDETTSTEANPSHSWSVPGTYNVTLTVDNGSCTATWTTAIVVETSTGLANTTAPTALNVWFANDKFVVEHAINNGLPVTIEVLDATGRLHLSRQVAGTPGRVNIAADGLSTGIWFVRVSNANATRTVRVPLVR